MKVNEGMIRIRTASVAAGLLSALAAAGPAHAVTTEELAKKLEALEQQNAALQAKVSKLEAAQSSQARQQAQAVEPPQPPAQAASTAMPADESAASTTVRSTPVAATKSFSTCSASPLRSRP